MKIKLDDKRALISGGSSGIGAAVTRSADGWAGASQAETTEIGALKLRLADVPTKDCADETVTGFAFSWKEAQHSECGNYPVAVDGPTHKDDDDVAKHGASTR